VFSFSFNELNDWFVFYRVGFFLELGFFVFVFVLFFGNIL
jgi:hypothetical protein